MPDIEELEYYPDGSAYEIKGKLHGGWGFWKHDKNKAIRTGEGHYGGCGLNQRNDVGELVALKMTLEDILTQAPKKVTIYQDASYAVKGFNEWYHKWIKNGWKTANGNPIANRETWKQIIEYKKQLEDKNIQIDCKHIKGHAGFEGNELADRCAKLGVRQSYEGENRDKSIVQFEDIYQEPKKAQSKAGKKPKPIKRTYPINEFFYGKMLINLLNHDTPKTNLGEAIYIMASWETKNKNQGKEEDDDNVREGYEEDEENGDLNDIEKKTCNLGLINPNANYSLVIAKESNEVIDGIRKKQEACAKTGNDNPYLIDWTNLKKAVIWNDLNEGKDVLDGVGQSVIYKPNELFLSYLLPAPRLARESIDRSTLFLTLLDQYRAGKIPSEDIDDITEYYFNRNDKGVLSPKKTTDVPRLIPHNCRYMNKPITLQLTQRVDIPDVASVVRMFKQDKQLVVKLVRYVKTPVSFRYMIIVEGADNTLMYSAAFSNLRLVP